MRFCGEHLSDEPEIECMPCMDFLALGNVPFKIFVDVVCHDDHPRGHTLTTYYVESVCRPTRGARFPNACLVSRKGAQPSRTIEWRSVTQDATAPVEGISNVEEPAFQRGAWRLGGLAIVFIAALLALYLTQVLVDWAAVVSVFPEARSLLGFIALWFGHSHSEALRAVADNPVRIFLGTAIRSIATVGTIYGLRGLLPARSMRAFGFVKPTGEQLFFGFGYSAVALFGGAAAQIILSPFTGRHAGVWIHIIATHHGFSHTCLTCLG